MSQDEARFRPTANQLHVMRAELTHALDRVQNALYWTDLAPKGETQEKRLDEVLYELDKCMVGACDACDITAVFDIMARAQIRGQIEIHNDCEQEDATDEGREPVFLSFDKPDDRKAAAREFAECWDRETRNGIGESVLDHVLPYCDDSEAADRAHLRSE